MKKLDHPNLVKLEMVLNIPDDDKMLLGMAHDRVMCVTVGAVAVMEHLGGGVAMGGKMQNEAALPESTARSYFRDCLCGLEYCDCVTFHCEFPDCGVPSACEQSPAFGHKA